MKHSAEENYSAVKNLTSRENFCLYMLEGGSMRPAFHEGDLLLLKKVPSVSLKPGNVIAFYSPCLQKTVIHRIIGFRNTDTDRLLLTRGDSSGRPDEPVQLQFVKGRVSARLSNGHFQPGKRYHELFWLHASRWRRSFRRLVKYLAVKITQIVFPVLPVRVRARLRGLKILKTAFPGKRMIEEELRPGTGNRVWIHPLFAKTRLNDRFRI